MSVLEAIFLGVLQGLTEFLPVSSSGHLVVAREFMAIRDIPILFDVLLHISTLLVVVLVFRASIARLIVSFVRLIGRKETDPEDRGTIIAILVATVCTGVLGILIEKLAPGGDPRLVGFLFLLTALILWLPRWIKPRTGGSVPGVLTGLIVGVAQGFGVFPGISRSGITISVSIGAGLNREKAGEFAFLVSIPAILGALLLTIRDFGELSAQVAPEALIAGVVSSFLVGFFALKGLLRLVKGGRLHYFSAYLIPLGILTLLIG